MILRTDVINCITNRIVKRSHNHVTFDVELISKTKHVGNGRCQESIDLSIVASQAFLNAKQFDDNSLSSRSFSTRTREDFSPLFTVVQRMCF